MEEQSKREILENEQRGGRGEWLMIVDFCRTIRMKKAPRQRTAEEEIDMFCSQRLNDGDGYCRYRHHGYYVDRFFPLLSQPSANPQSIEIQCAISAGECCSLTAAQRVVYANVRYGGRVGVCVQSMRT